MSLFDLTTVKSSICKDKNCSLVPLFIVGALLLFFYHILYMQKHNEYITFFLMGNDKEFAKTQIDKASSFLAGYNSNKDLIIKIYNKENK